MVNLILELSKYVMIFLMAVYTWANFRYFSFPDRERKLRLCARQNHVMFFMHFLAYMTLFLKAEDFMQPRLCFSWFIFSLRGVFTGMFHGFW